MPRGKLYTIPDQQFINNTVSFVPEYMSPNYSPYALVGEGVLSDQMCDAIMGYMGGIEPYVFKQCGATTREAERPLPRIFEPVIEFTKQANASCWRFDLDNNSAAAWLQSYRDGDAYQTHQDGVLGQTRKLTTVVMLSAAEDYKGGQLRIIPWPDARVIPPTRGTMVTFPGWLFHEVLPVISGKRHTLNLGMWGPPWR